MKPEKITTDPQIDMFKIELNRLVNSRHPMVKLAKQINWPEFDKEFDTHYSEEGRPAIPTRLMVSLHYLKYSFDLSDEATVANWVENPYWQYLSGNQYFEYAMPIDPSSMTRWRQRIGDKGAETLLSRTIVTGIEQGYLKRAQCERVSVDTTAQTKAIRFPTDARLYDRMRLTLAKSAESAGIELRQNYTRVGKRILHRQQNYAHAKQFNRAKRETKRLKTLLGRVIRDIERKAVNPSDILKEQLALAQQLMLQERDSKNKIYSIHEPQVECIAKGKMHQRYEFGCKVGFVVSAKGNWILGAQAFPGNPYDGHTIQKSLEHAEHLTETKIKLALCDLGHRGHSVTSTVVSIVPRLKNKASRMIRRWWKRRNAIEPIIGHQKSDHRLNRNQLAGELGDKLNVIFSASGFNFRKLLRAFWLWLQYAFNCVFPVNFQRTFS